ncbi:MAG: hypothetical protein KatS3mg010_1486 [Acidimicrobiia bacterium]|nr:MAG: hypothetical protein KatS3mg010_1486 [Acidimicrobiia bacterium]
MLFVNIPAILIVWIGSIGAVMISHPFAETANIGKVFQKVMKGGEAHSASETIEQIVTLTNRARAEGLLALEEEAKKIEDPFFRKGIELAVDGTDPEALKKTLNAEIAAMRERHKAGQQWFTNAGVFAPTFGIIGAVFGLMATMAHLDDPAAIGHGIAAAFVATFWGVFLANGRLPARGQQAEAAVAGGDRAPPARGRGRDGDAGGREPPCRRGAADVARAAVGARGHARRGGSGLIRGVRACRTEATTGSPRSTRST